MSFRNYLSHTIPGAGLSVLLALGACTENPPVPSPVYTEPAIPEPTNSATKAYAAYDSLYWRDEFDGTSLNSQNWQPEVRDVWYNNEMQATTSTRNNLAVVNGNLVLTAQQESYHGRNYTSARINTKGLRNFTFGRIDVRAKVPKGKGIWPAIWMLGANDSYVAWPACGEIDIMELRGSHPEINNNTLHFGSSASDDHRFETKAYTLANNPDLSDAYHVYSVVRSQDTTRWYVDAVEYYMLSQKQVSPYPFNNPFYMILNVAVGGDFDGPPDNSTPLPQQMLVDYVRYYKYKE